MIAFSLTLTNLIAISLALLGGFWALITIIIRQFNASLTLRFEVLEKARQNENTKAETRFKDIEAEIHQIRNDTHIIQLDLLRTYWKRDDAIRNEAVMQAKIDGLANHLMTYIKRKNQ